MCGITGFIANHKYDWFASKINSMVDILTHRGPDDQGIWINGLAAIGMRRLSIIDIEHGSQPLTSSDGELTIVFNGEIYNYKDLIKKLRNAGCKFKTSSDTEAILMAYKLWGKGCLENLRGMFAFAILNNKDNTLFLARDRMGIKPLYYSIVNNELIFASEIKSILLYPSIRRELNPQALDEYLALRYVPGPSTLIKGIKKFPKAHYMIWKESSFQMESYWRLNETENWLGNKIEAEEKFEELFDESTRIRMVSEKPVGAFLSGGLDSSAIVRSLVKQFPNKLQTFSVGFGWEGDELSFAAKTAKQLDCEHHEIICSSSDAAILPKVIWHLDEPVGDGIILPMFLLSKLASQSVTVVQSGEGADEILGGYFTHRILWYASIYCRLFPYWIQKGVTPLIKLIPFSVLNKFFDYPGQLGATGKIRLIKFLEVLSNESTSEQFRFIISLFSDEDRKQIYSTEFCKHIHDEAISQYNGPILSFNQMLRTQFDHWLPDDILCKQDKITMGNSLEGRVPFMDHKLVELVNSFPQDYKIDLRENKIMLRRYLERNGLKNIAKRKKVPFYIPIDKYLRENPLKKMVDELLSEKSIKRRNIIDWNFVKQIRNVDESEGFLHGKKIFSLAMFELWCRLFIDQEQGWL